MPSARLAARRSSAQSGLLATVCAVALVVTALVVGLLGYLDLAATVNTRAFLAGAAPTASAIRVEVKLADDPAAQSSAAETFFDREFAGLPVEITRTLMDYPLPAALDGEGLTGPEGGEARVTVASDAGFADHAAIVDGDPLPGTAASGSAVPGVLQADAARMLGLSVGDELVVGTAERVTTVSIVGTWRALDPDDPRWFGASGVATGRAAPAGDLTPSFGPLLIDEGALEGIGPVPFVHWTIVPDAASITPAELDRLGTIASGLRDDIIEDQTLGRGSILVSGSLAATASTVQNSLSSVRGVTPVGILLIGLIGLIALVQLARLLSLARRPENALLRSRGASAQWLTVTGLLESGVVALIGCALGFVAAAGTLLAVFGESAPGFVPGEFAVLIGAAVVAIFGVTAFRDAVRIARRDAIDDSGRTRAAATAGVAALAVAAAAVAVWQSLLYGSPLVTTASGRTAVDPLAVVAPTLALVAISLLLLVAFGPLTAAWQRMSARRRRLQPAYSARQLARGIGSYAVAVLVIALSVGGLTVASAYSGSWQALGTRTGELTAGADARIDLGGDLPLAGPEAVDGERFRAIEGVADAAPVLSTPLSVGDDGQARLTAIPLAALDTVVSTADGAFDPAAVSTLLGEYQLRGIELPVGTTRLSLETRLTVATAGGEPVVTSGYAQTTLWLASERGAVVRIPLPRVESDGSQPVERTLEAAVPESPEAWRIVAIDYSTSADGDNWWETRFTGLTATTPAGGRSVALDTRDWGQSFASFSFGYSLQGGDDSLSLGSPALNGLPTLVRLVDVDAPPGSGPAIFYSPDPLPVLVSGDLAEHYGVSVGDPFDLRFAGTGLALSGTVAGIVPLVPGIQSPDAVLADLTALEDTLLRTGDYVPGANELWLALEDPAAFDTAALDSALPEGSRLTTPATASDQSFAAPAELALWIAAGGSLLLAAISLGAVALTLARSRRGEVVVLRAVGLSARQQARSRLGELLAVIGLATVFGVVAGLIVSTLTVANLAKSAVMAVPAGLEARLEFAFGSGLALLAAAAVVLIAIGLAYSRAVHRQALDTEERLETR